MKQKSLSLLTLVGPWLDQTWRPSELELVE
jgi:hypothetical protein